MRMHIFLKKNIFYFYIVQIFSILINEFFQKHFLFYFLEIPK